VGHFVGHLFFVVISEFFDGLLYDASLGSFKNLERRWRLSGGVSWHDSFCSGLTVAGKSTQLLLFNQAVTSLFSHRQCEELLKI
jgi:hypothetical protein